MLNTPPPPLLHSIYYPVVMPFRMPFAGESDIWSPDSVLSHCYGALLPMFTTKEATILRRLCREVKSTVADFPWEDERTVVARNVAAWRVCFPMARCARVSDEEEDGSDPNMVDADFVHFVGLRRLDMSDCRSITDAAFVHLKGIHTLDMSGCNQTTITDAAFVHLKGIHTLNMVYCWQPSITDAALVHLKGIYSLSLFGCTQLTGAVFTHLKGVKRLNIGECTQLKLTDDSLKGIEWLGMNSHSKAQIEVTESLGYLVDQTLSFLLLFYACTSFGLWS